MKRFGLILIATLSFALPASAMAAGLSVSSSRSTVSVGDTLTLVVVVDSGGTAINAAEGSITLPADTFSVVSVQQSASIFSLWITPPTYDGSGSIAFNGGLPTPGYSGSSGTIFTATLRALKAGAADFSIQGAAVRANDGLGTDVLSAVHGAHVTVSAPAQTTPIPATKPQKSEYQPPQLFRAASTSQPAPGAQATGTAAASTTPQEPDLLLVTYALGFFSGLLLLTNFILWYLLVTYRRPSSKEGNFN